MLQAVPADAPAARRVGIIDPEPGRRPPGCRFVLQRTSGPRSRPMPGVCPPSNAALERGCGLAAVPAAAWEAASRRTQLGSRRARREALQGRDRSTPEGSAVQGLCGCFFNKKVPTSQCVFSCCVSVCEVCVCISDAPNSAVHVGMSHAGVALLTRNHLTGCPVLVCWGARRVCWGPKSFLGLNHEFGWKSFLGLEKEIF